MSAAEEREKGGGVGDELLVRTANRTPGAARSGPVPDSKTNQATPTHASSFHAPYSERSAL